MAPILLLFVIAIFWPAVGVPLLAVYLLLMILGVCAIFKDERGDEKPDLIADVAKEIAERDRAKNDVIRDASCLDAGCSMMGSEHKPGCDHAGSNHEKD